MSTLTMWWAGQAGWVRMMLTALFTALVVCWVYVAWLYRPRPRTGRVAPAWAGATEGWSPKAAAGAVGPSEDMTAASLERAKLIEAGVRLDVAERLDLEQRQAALTTEESRSDWALATRDLDRRLDRTVAAFTAKTGRILSAWEDTASWSVVAPAQPRPVRLTPAQRRRRDKRLNQGKAVAA